MSEPREELAEAFRALCPAAEGAPAPVQAVEHRARGVHLEFRIPADLAKDAARVLDERGFAIDAVTGIDWLAEKQMEVVYDFFRASDGLRVAVRARVPREAPSVPSIRDVFPGADWHERETHEMFGIRFEGHPNLTPLLLPEDSAIHPLRKDFAP